MGGEGIKDSFIRLDFGSLPPFLFQVPEGERIGMEFAKVGPKKKVREAGNKEERGKNGKELSRNRKKGSGPNFNRSLSILKPFSVDLLTLVGSFESVGMSSWGRKFLAMEALLRVYHVQ